MKNLFQNITPRNIDKILKIYEANHFTFKKGVSIVSSITTSNFIGFVKEGYLEFIKTDYNGNKTVIDDIEDNEIFGSVIMPLNNPDYDLITKEQTEVYIIDYDHIINQPIYRNNYCEQFIKNLLLINASQINNNNERLNILMNKTIRNKLLHYFRLMSKKNKSKIIYLPYTFTAMAEYLAIDRCAMSRELKYLKEEGFIEIKGKKITLLY